MPRLKTAPISKPRPKSKTRDNGLRLLLLCAILIVFGRTILNDFVNWDDGQLIYGNINLNPPTWVGLTRHWNPKNPANISMYDPLVFTAWWLLAHVAQLQYADTNGATLNPQLFHGVNLLVHWLAACVVLELLRRLRLPKWPAFAGALLFAIHPIQTEAVAWATALKDLLCGLLTLTAVWRYLIAEESHELRMHPAAQRQGGYDDGRSNSAVHPVALEWKLSRDQVLDYASGFQIHGAAFEKWNYIAATILYLGALLSKPSAVVAPLLVIVFTVFWERRQIVRAILPMISWIILGLGFIGIAKWVQNTSAITIPLLDRPLIAGDALAFYLGKLLVPINLCFDYGRDPVTMIKDPAQFQFAVYWAWIIPAALALVIWRLRRRILSLAGLIFVVGLLPVLGLTTFVFQYFSTVADRYTYVAMLGPAIAIAWLFARFPNRAVGSVIGVWFVILGGLSFAQAGTWHDTATLYQRNFALHDQTAGNWRLYITFGKFRDMQADDAFALGMAAGKRGDYKTQFQQKQLFDHNLLEAIEFYQKSLAQEPRNGEVYDDLATDYLKLGRVNEAMEMTRREIELAPRIPDLLRQNDAKLHQTLGLEYMQVKRYADAIHELELSLQTKDDPDVRMKLKEAREKLAAASRPAALGTMP